MKNKGKKAIEVLAKIGAGLKIFWKKVQRNTKYFTVLFFLLILVFAVWIWWDCFYHSHPSAEVVQKSQVGRKNYDQIGQKIQEVIEEMKNRQNQNQENLDLSNQRELFLKLENTEETSEIGSGEESEGGTEGESNAEESAETQEKPSIIPAQELLQ